MNRITDFRTQWALVGAGARLQQIQDEIEQIFRAFPELRGKRGGRAKAAVVAGEPERRKRKLPRDFKRSVSDGMRKYWARRKAQQQKPKAARA